MNLEASVALKREAPWHRLAAMLAAQGLSYKEIAERINRTPQWVATVLKQPYARSVMLEEIHRAGKDELEALLKGTARDCIWKLIELRDSAVNESVQLNAANSLLDRLLGKPTQRVETDQRHSFSVAEVEKIDEELKRLDEAERQIVRNA